MGEAHVEDPFWKSSKNYTDRCCNSCFTPGGCGNGCKKFGPPPPPAPPAPPINPDALSGTWLGTNGKAYRLSVDVATQRVTITNPSDPTSCWTTGSGTLAASNATIQISASGAHCTRVATGTLTATLLHKVVDVDYSYTAPAIRIDWTGVPWPSWTKQIGAFAPVYA
jgi:hypothetical protein